jgi:hypothetical protein
VLIIITHLRISPEPLPAVRGIGNRSDRVSWGWLTSESNCARTSHPTSHQHKLHQLLHLWTLTLPSYLDPLLCAF